MRLLVLAGLSALQQWQPILCLESCDCLCVQVAYNVADNVPKLVFCDAQRLQQILLNVLNNAVKFTEKGEILVEVWCEPQDQSPGQVQTHAPSNEQPPSQHDNQQQPALPQQAQHEKGIDQQQHSSGSISFRPLTPDNLSQHNEYARPRQADSQKQEESSQDHRQLTKEKAGLVHPPDVSSAPPCVGTHWQQQQEHHQQSSSQQAVTVRQLLAETAQRAQHVLSKAAQQAKQAALGQSDSQAQSGSTSSDQSSSRQQPFCSQKDHSLQAPLQPSPSEDSQATLAYQPQLTAAQHDNVASFSDAKPASTSEGQSHIEQTAAASASGASDAASHRQGQTSTSSLDTSNTSDESRSQSRRHATGGREDWERNCRFNSILPSISGRSSRSDYRSEQRSELSSDYTIHFSIRDSGIGISQDQTKNLFQRFAQASPSSVVDALHVSGGLYHFPQCPVNKWDLAARHNHPEHTAQHYMT